MTLNHSCDRCEEKFCSKSKLRVHSRTHEEHPKSRFPFECTICQRRFELPMSLGRHLRTHETNPNLRLPFPCHICPKRFSNNFSLKTHLRIHETDPNLRLPFPCHICPKRFSYKSNLKTHLIIHETDPKCRYPFKCAICQKKYGFATNLLRHLRSHEKVDKLSSSYSCRIGLCQKRFSTRSELTQHARTHEEVSVYRYSYVCDGCSRRFSTQQELHIHSRIHDKSFDCHRCGLEFQEENHLAEHTMVHWPTDNDPNSVSKNQFTQLKRDTIVSKLSISDPTSGKQFKYYVDKSKIFFHNSNMNTQSMGQEGKHKSHEEEQFTQKNLKYDEVIPVGHLCIQKNVCNNELCSGVSFKYHFSELEPHSNLKSLVECDICKGCFLDSQFLVKHLQLVHSISSQFDLYSNKTGLQESTPMNEDSNIVCNEYPPVHNVCSSRFSKKGCMKNQCSSGGRSYLKYEEEVLSNAHLASLEQFIQEEGSSIDSIQKNTNVYIHSMCQEENPKSGEEQQYMKNNLKDGTVIQQNDLCIDELTSEQSSRHQSTELESNWNLNLSVEFNFEQRFHDTLSSVPVGHPGLVDSRSTLTKLDLDPNKAELQDIKDFLKAEGFQFQ